MQTRYIITQCLMAVLLLSGAALHAQHKHELSLYGGGGLSTLQYDAWTGKQKDGLGGHFGLGYHFFFAPKWGVGTGVEVAFYNARYKLGQYYTSYTTTDPEDNAFEFRSTVNGYEEKQRTALLQIPLMLQFQTGKKHQFYAAAGGKVGFPVSGSYKSSNTEIRNSGYYAYEDYEYTTQTFMGFGTFEGKRGSGDVELKTAFLASVEAGVKWRLNESWSLYTGAYLDYGLNNVADAPEALSPFVAYNVARPVDFAVNSVFHAQDVATGKAFAESNITPIATGIKLRLTFGMGQRGKKPDRVVTDAVFPAPAVKAESVPPALPDTGTTADLADPEKERLMEAQEQQRLAEAEKAAQDEAVRKAEEAAKAGDAAEMGSTEKDSLQEEGLRPVGGYVLSETVLTNRQRQEWDKNIALLQRHPDIKFFIYGHTCSTGNAAVNKRIGLQRAENVKAYLMSKGITSNRILGTASKLDTEPLVPNDTEPNRRVNRRVELVPVSDR